MTVAHGGQGSSPGGSADEVRAVLERAHEAFIGMDEDGLVSDWNPQAERTFGWSSDEAVGQVLADLIIPARHRAAHWEGLRRHLDTGVATVLDKRLELSAIDRTGREFPVELTISRHGTRSPARFYAFLHDISERKRSERLLRARHAVTRVFAEAQSPGEAMSGCWPSSETRWTGSWARGGRTRKALGCCAAGRYGALSPPSRRSSSRSPWTSSFSRGSGFPAASGQAVSRPGRPTSRPMPAFRDRRRPPARACTRRSPSRSSARTVSKASWNSSAIRRAIRIAGHESSLARLPHRSAVS